MTTRLKWMGCAVLSLGLTQTSVAADAPAIGGTITGTVKVLTARPDDLPTVVYLTGLQESPPKESALSLIHI